MKKIKHMVKISSEEKPVTSCGYVEVNATNGSVKCQNGWIKNYYGELFERISFRCPKCNNG